MAGFHTKIRLSGYPFEDSQLTVKLAAGTTSAHLGKAMSGDASADNTMKPAGDGDEIEGVLLSIEDRKVEGQLVGTVTFRFAKKLPIKTGLTGNAVVTRGKRLIGAGNGDVKAIDLSGTPAAALIAAYAAAPKVWEVIGTDAVATKIA